MLKAIKRIIVRLKINQRGMLIPKIAVREILVVLVGHKIHKKAC